MYSVEHHQNTRVQARRLIFSQHVLDRMKDIYEMNIEIKVDFETTESLDDHTRFGFGTDETDGTDGTVSGEYSAHTHQDLTLKKMKKIVKRMKRQAYPYTPTMCPKCPKCQK